MSDGERRIIIVKRVKKVAAAHHGGSWKVAYADFVTAMMAFFMVMWILGMDQGVKDVVEGYFLNPVGFHKGFSGGLNPLSRGNSPLNSQTNSFMLMSRAEQSRNFADAAEDLSEDLDAAIEGSLVDAVFEVALMESGLRIEIMERAGAESFFRVGSSDLKEPLRVALGLVLGELVALPNNVVIEGHTDGQAFGGEGDYSNWELSASRANAARRTLVSLGLPSDRIAEVRGYADRRLKLPERPFAAENRRITLLLPYQDDIIKPAILSSAGGGGGAPPNN